MVTQLGIDLTTDLELEEIELLADGYDVLLDDARYQQTRGKHGKSIEDAIRGARLKNSRRHRKGHR